MAVEEKDREEGVLEDRDDLTEKPETGDTSGDPRQEQGHASQDEGGGSSSSDSSS